MVLVKSDDWRPLGIDDLEQRAWQALRETNRSVLVTAGAGAGKTEFLAQKAAYLLQTGLCRTPKRILAISFKRDAARTLEERARKRCAEEQARRLHSMTFDAFTKSFLDRFRKAIPAPWTPPSNYRIVFPSRRDYDLFLEQAGIHGVNTQTLGKSITSTTLPLEEPNNRLEQAVVAYWNAQYENHEEVPLSFPMINRLVEWMMRKNPAIRRALHITYPVVFLDEFQDTTYAQFELLNTVFDGSGAVFTAVGDDKQQIMRWAGAMDDAFDQFEGRHDARRISLLYNWRSHEDLVRIQHAIAKVLDPQVEYPQARANREVEGAVSAVWEFPDTDAENRLVAQWIDDEVKSGQVKPHDVAILVRMRPDDVEGRLKPSLAARGLRLRNAARNVGDISIQDLLGEDLTNVLIPLIRLGATPRNPKAWNETQETLQYLNRIDFEDDATMERLQVSLQGFVRKLRRMMRDNAPDAANARRVAEKVLEFVGSSTIRQAFTAYRREADFRRVWNGFVTLLSECAQQADTWTGVLDEFEGLGQVALMTIHKSKGLEFHTMIFLGLDNQTWWSLKPGKKEELNSFFVAFTRAKQRAFFTLALDRGQPVNWVEDILTPVGVHRIRITEGD